MAIQFLTVLMNESVDGTLFKFLEPLTHSSRLHYFVVASIMIGWFVFDVALNSLYTNGFFLLASLIQ